jgi:NADH-quinone oxidoreductase subunit A
MFAVLIHDYVPVVIQIVVAVVFAAGSLITSVILGKSGKRTKAKDMSYECGKDPIGAPNPRFSVKFYLVAMLFILFDIEVVFMYAWAVVYKELLHNGPGIFFSMLSFLGILFVGYLYALKKGAFDWNKAG